MMKPVSAALIAAILCAGPALAKPKKKKAEPVEIVTADWRKTATASDQDRLRDWRSAFIKALDKARLAGNSESIAREGRLLEPDAALEAAAPPAGQYRCRVIKLGAQNPRMADYVVYPVYNCSISDEGGVMGFAKAQGIQRPIGLFFPGDSRRMIFLGTMMLGDETRAMEYGRDSTRDMAGAFERIGEKRWRLILPKPRFESMMDVIEIVPISDQQSRMGSLALAL
jgi:hypothetical protein